MNTPEPRQSSTEKRLALHRNWYAKNREREQAKARLRYYKSKGYTPEQQQDLCRRQIEKLAAILQLANG